MNCQACNCQSFILLGYMGNRAFLRCRACGMDMNTDAALLEEIEEAA